MNTLSDTMRPSPPAQRRHPRALTAALLLLLGLSAADSPAQESLLADSITNSASLQQRLKNLHDIRELGKFGNIHHELPDWDEPPFQLPEGLSSSCTKGKCGEILPISLAALHASRPSLIPMNPIRATDTQAEIGVLFLRSKLKHEEPAGTWKNGCRDGVTCRIFADGAGPSIMYQNILTYIPSTMQTMSNMVCTAFLIAPARIVTAQHCLNTTQDQEQALTELVWVPGFSAWEGLGSTNIPFVEFGATEIFPVVDRVSQRPTYVKPNCPGGCRPPTPVLYPHGDYVVLQLGRAVPAATATPLLVVRSMRGDGDGTRVWSANYPLLPQVKVGMCLEVACPVKATISGSFLGYWYRSLLDSMQGDSGAPVLDMEGRVVGLVSGAERVPGTPCVGFGDANHSTACIVDQPTTNITSARLFAAFAENAVDL